MKRGIIIETPAYLTPEEQTESQPSWLAAAVALLLLLALFFGAGFLAGAVAARLFHGGGL